MPGNPNNPLLHSILSEPGAVPLLRSAGSGSDDEILIIEDFGPKQKLASDPVPKIVCAVPPVQPHTATKRPQPLSESDDEPELIEEFSTLSVGTNPKKASTAAVEPPPKRLRAATKPITVAAIVATKPKEASIAAPEPEPALSVAPKRKEASTAAVEPQPKRLRTASKPISVAATVATKPKETSTPAPEPQPKKLKAATKPIAWDPSQCRENLLINRKRVACTGELVDLDAPPQKKPSVAVTIKESSRRSVDILENFRKSLIEHRIILEKEEERRLAMLENLKKKGEIDMDEYKPEIERINLLKRQRYNLYMSFSTSMQLMREGMDILEEGAITTLG